MLIITTPQTKIENSSPDGAKLGKIYFNGDKAVKIFTIESTGGFIPGPESTTLRLRQGPVGSTGNAFTLTPGTTGSTASLLLSSPGDKASFVITYDSSKGDATEAFLYSTTSIYTPGDTLIDEPVLQDTVPLSFYIDNPAQNSKRSIGPMLNIDMNGDYMIEQASGKITQDETSFGLTKTNPKLAGNVKITVDSNNDIWLNSIDAEKELADDKYKKYRIGPDSSYAIDLNKFFDYGQTPTEIVYSLYQRDESYLSTKRSFDEQYDRFYQYGAAQLPSKFYDENFSFFAPLYLKTEIPEHFVIFRTTGPINKFTYETPFDEWKNHVTSDILSNSQIVKVFDLSEKSNIGKYLRGIVNHPARRESEITVSYQENGYTTFNGISYKNGTYVQAGELLYDYINEENPLSSVEEFVTLGFQRNGVISTHALNLEFLFNDGDAENYSINRYFGFYVNSIDLATFDLSSEALSEFSYDIGQSPIPRRGIDGTKVSQKSFIQTNKNGIKIYIENESVESLPKLSRYAFTSKVSEFTYSELPVLNTPPSIPLPLLSPTKYLVGNNPTGDWVGKNGLWAELDGTSWIFTIPIFPVKLPGKFDNKLEIGEIITFDNGSLTATAELVNFDYDGINTNLFFIVSSFISTVPLTLCSTFTNWSIDFYTLEKLKSFERKIFDNAFIENTPRLFYLKDNKNNLNSVSSTAIKYVNIDPFTQKEVIEVSLKDTKIDISNLSGFSNLLTQTESKLLPKGRSSISLEIKNTFAPNDFIEISWNPGPTASNYPLRWKVVANDTNLNPGEHWPSYTLTSDSEGEFYLSYFHPGDSTVNLSEFVKSIQNAFDMFPFKDFEVLAKGTFLHFRSTQNDRVSESAQIRISNSTSNSVYVMGIPADNGGVVNFIGASNRNKTRARISKSVAEGMLLDEYVSTKGSFAANRKYDILGSTIVFSPYLEEPVYDENGEKLVDFIDSDIYMVVSLSIEDAEIQTTSDGKITTYELYKPSFGILSVLPIKDFDTDYYLSDYTKSYSPELLKYFGREFPSAKIINIDPLASDYMCTFDRDFEFNSYPARVPYLSLYDDGSNDPVLHNEDAQFLFLAPGNYATLITSTVSFIPPTPGSSVLLLPDNKHLYFTEDILSKFKGFLTLSGIVSDEDEARFDALENLWDPSRFEPELLSEYDRLGENFLKSLVLKSRVVPYCLKWTSPQGRDVRDNPYRFNYHRSFGNMSFSPSENLQTPDPIFFTHEWPYLDSIPLDFPVLSQPESTFSYFYDELGDVYDLSSLSRDWFTQYFSVGFPIEQYKDSNGDYQSVKIDPFERYSYFNYENFSENTFTFFRGYKFQISEKDPITGQITANTQKYNNYRFSVIIKAVEEDPNTIEDPIEFKTIVNEKWKFIVLKITIRSASYRFPTGKIGYVDLYTFQNSNDIAYYDYTSSAYTLPGFYSSIPTDKKLSYPINLATASSDPTLGIVYNYYDSYPSSDVFIDNLVNQILPVPGGDYSNIIAYNDLLGFQTCATIPVPNGVYDSNTVELTGITAYLKLSPIPLALSVSLPYATISWKQYIFYHQTGGNNTLKDLTERLSFQEISKVVQGTSERAKMVYEIYKEDGSTINTPNFVLNTISPESLTRIFDYFPVTDPDKPSAFYNVDNIGVVLNEQKDLQTIYRYQGDFSPKFRDVLKFWLREDEEFTTVASRDFLLNNTHFAEELKDFSILNNQFYNKVADTEILTLSPDSGFSPVYPLINEIAIDKKTIFAWNSSWDQNYYRKYSNTSIYTEVKGTEEMKELKSFFGSKLMKVPDKYDLYQFILQEFSSMTNLEASNVEFGYYQTPTSVTLQINLYERLLREMAGTSTESRAKTEFLKALNEIPGAFDSNTLSDTVKQYLIDNIIDLYEIDTVKFYVLETGSPADNLIATATSAIPTSPRPTVEFSTTTLGNETYDENQLRVGKYIMKKDAKIVQLNPFKFQIVYPLDSRFFTSLSAGVSVRRI